MSDLFNRGAVEMVCSKLSSNNNSCLSRRKSLRLSNNKRLGNSGRLNVCAMVGAMSVGSLMGASKMKKTPSPKASYASCATRKARLVLR